MLQEHRNFPFNTCSAILTFRLTAKHQMMDGKHRGGPLPGTIVFGTHFQIFRSGASLVIFVSTLALIPLKSYGKALHCTL
jgi:hypothetical protein